MNWKVSLDRYLTTPPEFDNDFFEQLCEYFTEDFYEDNEEWLCNSDLFDTWLNKLGSHSVFDIRKSYKGKTGKHWLIDVNINFPDTCWIEHFEVEAKTKGVAHNKAKILAGEKIMLGTGNVLDAKLITETTQVYFYHNDKKITHQNLKDNAFTFLAKLVERTFNIYKNQIINK